MKNKLRIREEFLVLLFAWIFVIEATTFYVRSNRIDNGFQLWSCIMMFLFIVYRNQYRPIYVNDIFLGYIFLVLLALLPDVLGGRMAGIFVGITYLLPLILFLYITDYYHSKPFVNSAIFKIPLIYGTIAAIPGIVLEIMNFMRIHIPVERVFIEKTGNWVDMVPFGLGGYATWGQMLGRSLVRIQGYYIEPSKMAAFLLIPIFISWGFYKKCNRKRYVFLSAIYFICFLFTMSRAGFIAFIGAIVVEKVLAGNRNKGWAGSVNEKTERSDIVKLVAAGMLFILAAVLAIQLMVALSSFFPTLEFLHVGISDENGRANLIRQETVDIQYILKALLKKPMGYGFFNSIRGAGEIETNLANALVLWLVTGGIAGAIVAVSIVLMGMFRYGVPALKSSDPIKRSLAKSFIGLTIHGLSYGTWMTVDYLIILALLCAVKGKKIK